LYSGELIVQSVNKVRKTMNFCPPKQNSSRGTDFQTCSNFQSKHFTGDINSVSNSLRQCLHARLTRLHATWWRLCDGGAYTNVHAGYYRSFTHCLVRGVTAPLSQNRPLHCCRFGRLSFLSILILLANSNSDECNTQSFQVCLNAL
jgi:hypothetical protein